MAVVNYMGKNIHTLQGLSRKLDKEGVETERKTASFRFLPGNNEVPDDVMAVLEADTGYKNLVDAGKMQIICKTVGSAKTPIKSMDDASIIGMSAEDANRLINATGNVETLFKFKKEELAGLSRRPVLANIEQSITNNAAIDKELPDSNRSQPLNDNTVETVVTTVAVNVSEMSMPDAVDAIKKVDNASLLDTYQANENSRDGGPRAGVSTAIEKQRKKV